MAEKDLNDLLDDFNDQDTESLMKSILGEDNLPEEEDLKSLKKPKIKKLVPERKPQPKPSGDKPKSKKPKKDLSIPEELGTFEGIDDLEGLIDSLVDKSQKETSSKSHNSLKNLKSFDKQAEQQYLTDKDMEILKQQTIAYREGKLKDFEEELDKKTLEKSRKNTRITALQKAPKLGQSLKNLPGLKKKKVEVDVKQAEFEEKYPDIQPGKTIQDVDLPPKVFDPNFKSGLASAPKLKPSKPQSNEKFDLSLLPFEDDFLISTKGILNQEELSELLLETYRNYLKEHPDFDMFHLKKEGGLGSSLLSLLSGLIFNKIPALVWKLVKGAFSFLKKPGAFFGRLFKSGIEHFKKGIDKVWKPIKEGLAHILENIKKLWSSVKNFFGKYGAKIAKWFKDVGSRLTQFFSKMGNKISSVFKTLGGKIGNLFTRFSSKFSSIISKFKSMGGFFTRQLAKLKKVIQKGVQAAAKGLKPIVQMTKKGIQKTQSKLAAQAMKRAQKKAMKKMTQKATEQAAKKVGGKLLVKGATRLAGKALAGADMVWDAAVAGKEIYEKGVFNYADDIENQLREESLGGLLLEGTNLTKFGFVVDELARRGVEGTMNKLKSWGSSLKEKVTKAKKKLAGCDSCPLMLEYKKLEQHPEEEDSEQASFISYCNDGQNAPILT